MSKVSQYARITFFLLFTFIYYSNYGQLFPPTAYQGKLDASAWDFENDGSIKLDGSWAFYWNELLSPTNLSGKKNDEKLYFDLPKIWNKHKWKDEELPALGFATYTLRVIGDFKDKRMALEIPDMYCSYNIWVNNELIANNGVVGTTKEETIPQWIPSTKTFISTNDTLNIILNIANFHHSKGGNKDPILLGIEQQLLKKRNSEVKANITEIIGLALLTIVSLFLYIMNRDILLLYFTLFSFAGTVRSLFVNMYLINDWFPSFNWTIGTKLEYISLYFSLLLGIQIVGKMYIEHSNSIARYMSIAVNGMFILLTLVTPTTMFSKMLTTYHVFAGLIALYMIIIIVNALLHEKKGAGYLSVAILIITTLFVYELFAYQKLIPFTPYATSIGYLIVYYINGFGLWAKLSHVESSPIENRMMI